MTANRPRFSRIILCPSIALMAGGCSLGSLQTSDAPSTRVVVAESPPAPPSQQAVPVAPAPVLVQAPEEFSPGIEEIVKLARAGVGEEVLLAFIAGAKAEHHPTAEEIVYLSDLGVSARVMAALVGGRAPGQQVARGASEPIAQSQPAPPPQPAEPAPETPAAPEATPAAPPAVIVQQPVVLEQPATEVVDPPEQDLQVVRYFWPSLEPFGTWIKLNSHGWCWRPTVAVHNPSWRPYCDRGRWIYTDCGWYWLSDYSWGWAPFHYGRWFLHSSQGWCWVPDTVWSPAWVSWRCSPQYAGWAPLPPSARFHAGVGFAGHHRLDFGLHWSHYTFLPVHRLCDAPTIHRVGGSFVQNVFADSTVINNFHSGSGDIVINSGLPLDQYTAATGQAARPVRVRNLAGNARPDQLHRDGETLLVYRPQLSQLPLAPSTEDIDRSRQEVRKPATFESRRRAVSQGATAKTPASLTSNSSSAPAPQSSRPAIGSPLRQAPPSSAAPMTPVASTMAQPIVSGSQPASPANPPSLRHVRQEAVKPQPAPRSVTTLRTGAHGMRAAPGVESPSPPQPITSVPQAAGVDTRPFTPPQPLTSVPAAPGVATRPLTPLQPVTSVPTVPGVENRPLTPPQPVTSVPQVPGVEQRPFPPPRPVTFPPADTSSRDREVRSPDRYEPARSRTTLESQPRSVLTLPSSRPVIGGHPSPLERRPPAPPSPAAPAVVERAPVRPLQIQSQPPSQAGPQFTAPAPAAPPSRPSAPAVSGPPASRPAAPAGRGGAPLKRADD